MILEPKKATKKVCPLMSRQFPTKDQKQLCLADGCMKWRWAPLRSPDEFQARKEWHSDPSPPAGYCGA